MSNEYDGTNGNGYQPKGPSVCYPKPPPSPPPRYYNGLGLRVGKPKDTTPECRWWYLAGCAWCFFMLGIAVGGAIT